MSLNVTVTKGHDFTTGPVTRAALNAAATPTVSMTGSVSASEIADGAITGAKITGTDADAIPNSKVAVTSGSIVVGTGSPGVGSELAAGTSGQILVGNGSTLASVAVSGDATLSSAGALSIGNTKVTGAMLNAAIVDDATIEIDSASNSLKVKSIAATNIGSGSNGGVIGFNSSGVGANVAAGNAGEVLTSNGTSDAPSFQSLSVGQIKLAASEETTDTTHSSGTNTRTIKSINLPINSYNKILVSIEARLLCDNDSTTFAIYEDSTKRKDFPLPRNSGTGYDISYARLETFTALIDGGQTAITPIILKKEGSSTNYTAHIYSFRLWGIDE